MSDIIGYMERDVPDFRAMAERIREELVSARGELPEWLDRYLRSAVYWARLAETHEEIIAHFQQLIEEHEREQRN